jgi:hypothetical protein
MTDYLWGLSSQAHTLPLSQRVGLMKVFQTEYDHFVFGQFGMFRE